MRTSSLLLAALFVLPVFAAQPRLVPLPEIPPPPGMVDPALEPQITIIQRGNERVEEFRIKDKLYMIRITPPHGRPYYLVDQRGDGAMRRYDDLSPNFQVPLWVISEF
ncbi:MAG: DUF2782 domain-containing protein [Pseudomonadota bacterium]|nr:DUF2782 domain-containing protein [Pseudomonadota bacterium]MDP1905274.1 DUF2782 domain-containing protein [Pseudomonadota bacterium]MDP2352560.1 DUF2782 domain-containing protein [Pseudomonadota bacterium]